MGDKQKGLAIASLVLGILSIVCCCIWYFSCIAAIAGLALGAISMQGVKPGQNGLGLAGIITSSIGLFLSVFLVFITIMAYMTMDAPGQTRFNPGSGTALRYILNYINKII